MDWCIIGWIDHKPASSYNPISKVIHPPIQSSRKERRRVRAPKPVGKEIQWRRFPSTDIFKASLKSLCSLNRILFLSSPSFPSSCVAALKALLSMMICCNSGWRGRRRRRYNFQFIMNIQRSRRIYWILNISAIISLHHSLWVLVCSFCCWWCDSLQILLLLSVCWIKLILLTVPSFLFGLCVFADIWSFECHILIRHWFRSMEPIELLVLMLLLLLQYLMP